MKQEAKEHIRKRIEERGRIDKMNALNMLYGWYRNEISLVDAMDAVDELAKSGEIDY